jgi:hypothetical protein
LFQGQPKRWFRNFLISYVFVHGILMLNYCRCK